MSHQTFKQKDVRILRECLAWCFKNAPPLVQTKIDTDLKYFATRIKPYCTHDENTFVKSENKYACLDCGTRSDNEDMS